MDNFRTIIRVRVRVQLFPIDPNPNFNNPNPSPNCPLEIIVHEMYIFHVIYTIIVHFPWKPQDPKKKQKQLYRVWIILFKLFGQKNLTVFSKNDLE